MNMHMPELLRKMGAVLEELRRRLREQCAGLLYAPLLLYSCESRPVLIGFTVWRANRPFGPGNNSACGYPADPWIIVVLHLSVATREEPQRCSPSRVLKHSFRQLAFCWLWPALSLHKQYRSPARRRTAAPRPCCS